MSAVLSRLHFTRPKTSRRVGSKVSSLEKPRLKKGVCITYCFSTQELEKHLSTYFKTKFRTMIQYKMYLMTEMVLVEIQVCYSHFIFFQQTNVLMQKKKRQPENSSLESILTV